MNSLLTHGLRNPHRRAGGDWRELVTRAIRGEWPVPAASPRTLAAEPGLGILGKPYYFFVLRAEDEYGFVVFVFSEAEGAVWPTDARGATPFDSGGWWWGKIHTDSSREPLDAIARKTAFQTLDVPLSDWMDDFKKYIHSHYGTVGHYIKGCAPRSRDEFPEIGFTIIKGSPNTARAWTWEVRVPHELIAGRLTLQAVHMTEASRDDYLDWLPRSRLADSEIPRIYKWVSDHVIVPKQDESVVRSVTESMELEAAHG